MSQGREDKEQRLLAAVWNVLQAKDDTPEFIVAMQRMRQRYDEVRAAPSHVAAPALNIVNMRHENQPTQHWVVEFDDGTGMVFASFSEFGAFLMQRDRDARSKLDKALGNPTEYAARSSTRLLDRDSIMATVESYFERVRKLGGDSGECSAAGLADFLLYRAATKNFDPAVAVSAIAAPTVEDIKELRGFFSMINTGCLVESNAHSGLSRCDKLLDKMVATDGSAKGG